MEQNGTRELALSEVTFREDLYPRIKANPEVIQKYAENLEVLPPIEVNQHNELIDGYHRWTAHRKAEAATIQATVTPTASESEFLRLAIKRNAAHGLQLEDRDKRSMAIRLYAGGTGLDKNDIADTLSVSRRSVTSYLSDVDKQLRKQRKEQIFNMWLACCTYDEIATEVGLSKRGVGDEIETLCSLGNASKSAQSLAQFMDSDFAPPLYNVWAFSKKTNNVSHFGNSEQRILENLLYLYTDPFDIVVDPFGGGGATIDVCRRRLRRYWVSDRKPIVERENEIRQLDVATEIIPLYRNWSEVTLTYLDPPYWKQAEGKYSDDPQDLANMPLDQFTGTMAGIVHRIAGKQSRGVIALLMQPTQWNAPERRFTDHVFDLIAAVGNKSVVLENRVSCPYSTEQCTPQMVEWAKEHNQLLVISRELIIWRVVN